MRTFKNTPKVVPVRSTLAVSPKPEEEPKQASDGNWVWETIKILSVILVVGFLSFRAYTVGKNIVRGKQEILFSYSHPELVKPIREIYEQGHAKTDEELKSILNVGK